MDLNETLISTDLLKYFEFSYINNKCVITFFYFFVMNRELHLIQLNREVIYKCPFSCFWGNSIIFLKFRRTEGKKIRHKKGKKKRRA